MFKNYPYTNFHELNQDWILEEITRMRAELSEFYDQNQIKYADPLGWNISSQYQAGTIVQNPDSGVLYLSKKPVPAGVTLVDTDYWIEIGNFDYQITFIKEAVCAPDEGDGTTALYAHNNNTYFWWNDNLFKASTNIAAGAQLESGTNCYMVTVATELSNLIGGWSNHSSQIAAINNSISALNTALGKKEPSFPNRKYVFLGDSYGTTICNYLTSYMGLDNTTRWQNPVASARFGANSGTAKQYKTLLAAYNSSIPKADITDIVVETAGNDFAGQNPQTVEEVEAAVEEFVSYAKAQFPNAKIQLFFCEWAQVPSSKLAKFNAMNSLKDIIDSKSGISWIRYVDQACKDNAAANDTTHPSTVGLSMYAKSAVNALESGTATLPVRGARTSKIEVDENMAPTANTSDVGSFTSTGNPGFLSEPIQDNIIIYNYNLFQFYLKTAVTVATPQSYNGNFQFNFTVDMGNLDQNRYFNVPVKRVILPLNGCAVRFKRIENNNNVWRFCTYATLEFVDVDNECHPQIRIFFENTGGPDTTHDPVQIAAVRFLYNTWIVPAYLF